MWEQVGTPDSTPRAAAPPAAWSATAASTSVTSLSRFTMIALAVTLVATLVLPIAVARRANLTSDESLYLAEAHAIAGGEDWYIRPASRSRTARPCTRRYWHRRSSSHALRARTPSRS